MEYLEVPWRVFYHPPMAYTSTNLADVQAARLALAQGTRVERVTIDGKVESAAKATTTSWHASKCKPKAISPDASPS